MHNAIIYPLHVGTLKKVLRTPAIAPDDFEPSPLIAYLIRTGDTWILVDTGACDPEWSQKYHHRLERPEEMKVENQLKRYGVQPEDIQILVCSHLHWDHAYNLHLFPNAKIYVQKRELEFAIHPIPSHYVFYEAMQMGLTPPWLSAVSQFEIIDGDFELMPGITLVTLPGHTPGQQGVLVETDEGRYLIASDCVATMDCWENREFGLPIPSSIHVDLEEYYETFRKMLRISDFILPGHDFCVFDHPCYPDAAQTPD